MTSSSDTCGHCGAPKVTGYAACKFCKTPFVDNTLENAIPCPACKTLNEWGAQKCVECRTWVVVKCVFCESLSPHHVAGCLQCGEAFLGAPERLQQRNDEASRARNLRIAGTVGGVAAQFLGGVAAGVLAGQARSFFGGDASSGGGGIVDSLFGDDDEDGDDSDDGD